MRRSSWGAGPGGASLAGRFLLVMALAAGATWLGQEILRSGMLAGWTTSPALLLWGSPLPPLAAAWLFIGWRIRSRKELVLGALAAGAGSLLFEFAAAHLGHPLHGSSWALQQPLLFWTIGPVAYAAVWLIVLAPFWLLRRGRRGAWRRRR